MDLSGFCHDNYLNEDDEGKTFCKLSSEYFFSHQQLCQMPVNVHGNIFSLIQQTNVFFYKIN